MNAPTDSVPYRAGACPKCASRNRLQLAQNVPKYRLWRVVCQCGISGPWEDGDYAAVEGWNDCVAFPEGSVDWPVLLASANEANAKLYRPSSLECINALAELVALTHAAGVARPTTEQERRRAKLEMMLENALWNVDLSRRVLARWHGYDTVVRAVQRELQRRPGGPELADAIELARDRIGGQP